MTHLLNWLVDQGLTVAVAVSAAFAIFKLLGSHWMEAQFSKRLEEVKHGQNQELERLRYRINALMDRTSKLHQHEFEVLPELWHKLGIAYTSTKHFTSRILKQHDLNNMSYGELADFLATSKLTQNEKDRLLATDNKTLCHEELIFWHNLSEVTSNHADFHNYFISKGIFIFSPS